MNAVAARLFEYARAEVQPPPGARERVLAAVLAAPPATGPSGGAASAAVTSGKLGVAGVTVIALAIVGAFVATRHPKADAPDLRPATAVAPPATPQSFAPPADSAPPANVATAPDLRPATGNAPDLRPATGNAPDLRPATPPKSDAPARP